MSKKMTLFSEISGFMVSRTFQIAHKMVMVATVTSSTKWLSSHRKELGVENLFTLLMHQHCLHTASSQFPHGQRQSNYSMFSLSTSNPRLNSVWNKKLSKCIQVNLISFLCNSSMIPHLSTAKLTPSLTSSSHQRSGPSLKIAALSLAQLLKIPFSVSEEINSSA